MRATPKGQAPTLVDLLRHGEPVGGRRYRGKMDDPLSEHGWEQMRNAAAGDPPPWEAIVSSPLSRCRGFAEELADRLTLPIEIDERLQEVGFGAWEGQTREQLIEKDATLYKRFYQDPISHRPIGAEPITGFIGRVTAGFDAACQAHRGQHILLVVHAGVIRAVISRILQIPPRAMFRIKVDNAHFTRVQVDPENPPSLLFHGRDRL